MRKIQTQILSIVTVMLIGLTMFSMANATTPEENSKASAVFLAENTKKANIVTTASGLQYEVLTQGTGTASPAATDTVTVHYKGTTLDGTEFDSSYSRGAPASFPLNRVIAGWIEGVQLMQVGDKFRFYIPSDLAYGSEGAGRLIGPNAALIFEVELIKIQ
ncbi:MAG: FKBP-type peptidyl-prolyl cis-trans isomerase [Methylococcales bacterium]|nr:FKBP-type peptidyl-prolyl cis-trans isomerase [Methylococcales bacterium]